jgi:hypothetical protein
MPREIANSDLTANDIPAAGADWHTIGRFALTFNGYEHSGSFGRCAEIANRGAKVYEESRVLPDSLTGLRTCLFFEQRRWRHYGYDPDEQAMTYIQALVEKIRALIRAQEGE